MVATVQPGRKLLSKRQVARLGVVTALLVGGTIAVQSAQRDFDGWCFTQDICYGPSVIKEDSFGWCEGECSMTEPTRVREMQAMLYWVECDGGDSAIPFEYRLFLSKYKDTDGQAHVVAVTSGGPEELIRCDDGR